MRTLLLVRHGETVGNSSIRYFGRTDLELSELGRAQMRAARRWLRSRFGAVRFAPVIASPLRRAMEGATIIARPDGSIVEIEEFVEVDFGRFEGLTAEEIAARYPAEFEHWNRNRLDPAFSYPGGESRGNFIDRVERGIQRMLSVIDQSSTPALASCAAAAPPTAADDSQPSAGEVVLMVAHRGVIRIVCDRLAGVEPRIDLGSIQILEADSSTGSWHTVAIDVVEHLATLE